jgi:hypothetical protein
MKNTKAPVYRLRFYSATICPTRFSLPKKILSIIATLASRVGLVSTDEFYSACLLRMYHEVLFCMHRCVFWETNPKHIGENPGFLLQ